MELLEDLFLVQKKLSDLMGFSMFGLVHGKESQEYGACEFKLNERMIHFRIAKTTPTKTGQFVTFWKRTGEEGPIQPYEALDAFDFLVIMVKHNECLGQFVFPKTVLIKQGILSHGQREGKRAIRVYAPWYQALNKQAEKTQKWQASYFLDLSDLKKIDWVHAQKFYEKK